MNVPLGCVYQIHFQEKFVPVSFISLETMYSVSGTTSHLNSPLIFLEMSKDSAKIIMNKCKFYDKAIQVIDAIPNQIRFDPDNFKERKILNLEKNLKCSNSANKQSILNKLQHIYKYFSIKYFENHPRKCTNGHVTKLGGDHHFCQSEGHQVKSKMCEDALECKVPKKDKIEKLAFKGQVDRGIKLKAGDIMPTTITSFVRRLRQKEFQNGCTVQCLEIND